MNNRCAVVKVREDAVGPGVGKVPEEELEAPGADTEVVELRPPPAGARSRERLLSRYAVVVGEGTKELGDNEGIQRRTDEYQELFANPFIAASRGYIDDVIMPAETRERVCRSFAMLKDKKLENPWRKHGNIPL